MDVNILADGYIQGSNKFLNLESITESIVSPIMDLMNIPNTALERIIVADDANYGSAIKQLNPEEDFTNVALGEQTYQGVGKTIPRLTSTGSVVSSIVLRLSVIYYVLEASHVTSDYIDWDVNAQNHYYTIAHELGHCLDHHLCQRIDIVARSPRYHFKIRNEALYYVPILFSEFIAAKFSAKFFTPKMHEERLILINNFAVEMQQILKTMTRSFDGDDSSLREIAFNALDFFWRLLIFYAELIGTRSGNGELKDLPFILWPESGEYTKEVLDILEKLLVNAFDIYPAWPQNMLFDTVLKLWLSFSATNGFKFTEGADGDSISW